MLAVDSATVIEIGDLVYFDTDDAKPASVSTYGASLAATQETFHDNFAGVAMQASAAGETAPIRVATSGVFEFAQAAATVQVGARLGADDNDMSDALLNQQVIAVATANPERAIGRCARLASAATTVYVSIQSTIMCDGPQAAE
jgi:hypothetical protein